MRWTTVLLLIVVLPAGAAAQSRITLREKNAPLDKILSAIEKQSLYVFLYDPNELKVSPITISTTNATLQQILETIFTDQPVEFTIVGNNVLLKSSTSPTAPNPESPVYGKVTDESGQPMEAVTVFNRRTKKASQTDAAGAFTIAAAKNDILSFSFVGYTPRQITITGQRSVELSLDPALVNANPEQVVVVGYGNSKRKDLTGSISTVDMKYAGEIPLNTLDNALAGMAPGVQAVKTDGTPGGMVRVRVRGASSLLGGNDPLYVIDDVPVQVRSNFIDPGFKVAWPVSNLAGTLGSFANPVALSASYVNALNSLGGLPPDQIESLTILKDASSTAIYGSKAANGVVIITTKRGRTGMPPQVTLDSYLTFSSDYRRPKLLNATQYKMLLTEAAQNAYNTDLAAGFPADPLTTAVLDSSSTFFGAANTDWIKAVVHNTLSTHTGISVSGGGAASKYYSSISYDKTPGVLDGTAYQRVSGKLNWETHITPKLTVAGNWLLAFTHQDISAGSYVQALLARPDWAIRDNAGSYTQFNQLGHYLSGSEGFLNPVALTTATNTGATASLLSSISGSYIPAKDLLLRSTLSLNRQTYNQRNYLPGYLPIGGIFTTLPNPGGIGSEADSRFTDWFIENTLNYSKALGSRNTLAAVVGQSYETTTYSYFRATASGYPNDNFLNGLSSASTPVSTAGDDPRSPQSYLLSFYARINYSHQDKYLVTVTGRTDGSSKFGPDNKFGYFPSAALAWRLSKERFLKLPRWIDDWKLRGSYGLTGNQNIGDQMYRTLYTPVSIPGGTGLIPTQLGNRSIKWESTKQADIGLDLMAFAGRLNVIVDYYNKQTSDGLISLPIGASTSYATILQNAVGLRHRGLEVGLGGEIVHRKNLRWTVSVNATWNHSLVTRLDPRADLSAIVSPSGLEATSNLAGVDGNTALAEGKPLGLISGYRVTGIIKNQAQLDAYKKQLGAYVMAGSLPGIGDPMYQLDTTYASYGYQIPKSNNLLARAAPSCFGGLNQQLAYKRWDLQCYFTFSAGGYLLWAVHQASIGFYQAANADRSMLNRYTLANTHTNQPGLSLNQRPYVLNNQEVFPSAYFKFRSLILSYRLKNIQLFVSATNIFTITRYPGADPETSDDPYSVSGGYLDVNNYPAIRSLSFGLKAVF